MADHSRPAAAMSKWFGWSAVEPPQFDANDALDLYEYRVRDVNHRSAQIEELDQDLRLRQKERQLERELRRDGLID